MFMYEIWLFDWYFPPFCKSDMSKYRYLEVFQRVPSILRYRESTVFHTENNIPYFSMCSFPAFPNICAASGPSANPLNSAIAATCLSNGLLLSWYCKYFQ